MYHIKGLRKGDLIIMSLLKYGRKVLIMEPRQVGAKVGKKVELGYKLNSK